MAEDAACCHRFKPAVWQKTERTNFWQYSAV